MIRNTSGQFKANFETFLLGSEIFGRDIDVFGREGAKPILIGLLSNKVGESVKLGAILLRQPVTG
jgi:hypothetical protein